MNTSDFPRMMLVQQEYPLSPDLDIPATVRREAEKIRPRGRVAVAVGSRGISNLDRIVAALLDALKAAGASPFIVPAMGSHGGATPEGQRALLADYGITEARLGVPVEASMETEDLGPGEGGVPAHCSREALRADGIVIVNRVKPHTDFAGRIASGLLKMIAIGLGKEAGATAVHGAALTMGHERAILNASRQVLKKAPILGGLAILENQRHETERLEMIPAAEIEAREEVLQAEARRLMPRIPLDEIDVLIVDRLGKNISGAGMDPNVTGRGLPEFFTPPPGTPRIRRLFVRDLTPETHGNGVGVGAADFTTTRLVRAMDLKVTYTNSVAAISLPFAKIPIHFDSDREGIAAALKTSRPLDPRQARVARIQDTVSLRKLEISEGCSDIVRARKDLTVLRGPGEMKFDASGNLPPLEV
jgi:hypothetical protein